MTLPVFLIFIVLPAAASIYESGAKLWQGFLKAFSARTSEMYPPERDVCNEWVARVGRFDKRDHAQSAKEELRSAMEREDEVTWADKVYIVRDIEASDHYLLVVDMFSGPSDAGSVSDEIQRIRAAHPGVLGSALEASGPFYYRASLFEKRYGKLAPSALRCYYKEE